MQIFEAPLSLFRARGQNHPIQITYQISRNSGARRGSIRIGWRHLKPVGWGPPM